LTSEQPPLEEFGEDGNDLGDENWEEVTFSEVISINDYPSAEKGEEYRSVGMSDLARNQRKIQGSEYKEYSYSRPRFRNGQTLMARITPCLENGKTAFVDILGDNEVAVGSTEFIVLSDTDRTLPKFVYYTARRPEIRQFAIKRMTGTSGRQRVPLDIFDNKKINLPPIEEQKKIVSILDAIDSKIEINNRVNEILEEMAQALFRSRFVDFDPYDEFKQSELGDIPEEFEVKELSELLSLEYGEGLSKEDRDGDEYPVYGSNGVNGSHSDSLAKGPGVIVGRKGTIGTVNYEPRDFWCIDTTFYLEPKREYDMVFYYHLLKNGVRLKHLGSDSAVPGLNRNTVHDQRVAIPGKERVAEFTQLLKPMYEIKQKNRRESKQLEELRDTLLPKLMSGEIRVNDIELDELEVDSEV
jgi:type I restriction enzyme S subunit